MPTLKALCHSVYSGRVPTAGGANLGHGGRWIKHVSPTKQSTISPLKLLRGDALRPCRYLSSLWASSYFQGPLRDLAATCYSSVGRVLCISFPLSSFAS